jgi:tRNA-specific 2-thiouridylase
MKKTTVFVGMSGGVDSSVSAALLKEKGYEVVGVFIKTWHPDFLSCNEEAERLDAIRVAAYLDIPFLTFDFEDVYKHEVADYMISEYRLGRTPNPDVMCNKHVKFGAFLKKALSMGADYVATGHYAQVKVSKDSKNSLAFLHPSGGTFRQRNSSSLSLTKGIDPTKDQSYFLWTLKQDQLSKILFPVGHLNKTEVRKIANRFKLPVAQKKDSQGICFLGAIDLKEFLKHYIKPKKGKVCNEKGEFLGYHDGAVFYTIGERHGFTITKKKSNDTPYYVVGKNIKKNILTVSQNRFLNHPTALTNYRIENSNWISEIPKENKKYTAQIRYHGEFLPCRIKFITKFETSVIFEKPVLVASGQSCVFYDQDICLGGGVVV